MRDRFIIEGLKGEKTLRGEIRVNGAKNAATKAIAASLLFADELQFENMPEIEDLKRMQELLRSARPTLDTLNPVLDKTISERMRSSVVMTGPMLARTGSVIFPYPGGCVLGERPIDLFLMGFEAMGAKVQEQNGLFTVTASASKLRGGHISFPFVSVTATETLMLAAVLAEGETILENAAMEPEIPALAEFLTACGARITGAGTPTIRIMGGELLEARGRAFCVPPDRIEAGSFVILAALLGDEVTITHCNPEHMRALLALLSSAGVDMTIGADSVVVRGGRKKNSEYHMPSVRTHEYPGFPTDLQAPMAVFMSQAQGEGTILETIFDARFRYADDLVRMGADITVMNPHRMLIRGPRALTCKELESPDLRGGLAYIIAASLASGTSVVSNAYVIDRGYERIEERLRALGLFITRESSD